MHLRLPRSIRRPFLSFAAGATGLLLAACGGGDVDEPDAAPSATQVDARPMVQAAAVTRPTSPTTTTPPPEGVATTNTLQVGIKIPNFPHKVDVYRPAGATRAIVFLHGLGGRTSQIAYQLGINLKQVSPQMQNTNWNWLTTNGIIAIFPQAQNKPGTTVPAWSDYMQSSGQDDVGFLKSLATYAKTHFGATEVSLAGHSDGGAMTGRMWCEATNSFKVFASLAGPMPSPTYPQPSPPCKPVGKAPYYVVIGAADTTLQMYTLGLSFSTPAQIAVGLDNLILTSEWEQHTSRAQQVCGETPVLEVATFDNTGETWNSCNGHIRYQVVTLGEHPISTLDQYAGIKMVDAITAFAKQP